MDNQFPDQKGTALNRLQKFAHMIYQHFDISYVNFI